MFDSSSGIAAPLLVLPSAARRAEREPIGACARQVDPEFNYPGVGRPDLRRSQPAQQPDHSVVASKTDRDELLDAGGPRPDGDPFEHELLRSLRALEPVIDTIATIPVQELSHLQMDPEEPVPGVADGSVLVHLDDRAIDELDRVAGARSGSPLLSVEVRHLGGELGRARPQHGAISSIEGEYVTPPRRRTLRSRPTSTL
jgi:hypothetical protein